MPVTSGLAEATVKRWQPRTRTWRNSVFISRDGDVEVWWGPQWRRVCLFAMFGVATYMRLEDTCLSKSWIIWYPKCTLSELERYYILYPFHDTMSSYGSRVNISLTAQQILKYYGNSSGSKKLKMAAFFPPLPVSFQRKHNARASHSFRGKVYLPLFVRMIHTFFLNYTFDQNPFREYSLSATNFNENMRFVCL